MLKRMLTGICAVLLAACSGDPAGSAELAVSVRPDGESAVAVTNTSDEPVYYMIYNPDALASWAPCTSPADCPEIGPGETVRIPYAQIQLYQPESTEAELHWWQFARVGDGYATTGKGSARIRL
jgi:hypothetical protein